MTARSCGARNSPTRSGKATFATIYPGWYQGRTVHIHVKVHVSGKVIHVGQLFFDDTFTDAVYAATAPYSSRSARATRQRGRWHLQGRRRSVDARRRQERERLHSHP